ncbi:MAG: hypothetical protein ACYTG2_00480 [Planctomycetota bacterium]
MSTRSRDLLLLLATSLLTACAAQKSATVRESYQRSETGDDSQASFTNLVEIGVQDQVGPDLEYRFSDRLIDGWVDLESSGVKAEEDRFLHQPSFDTEVTFGLLTWTQGIELQESTRNPSDGPENTLLRKDILEKLEWSPVGLPRVVAWFDTRSDRDDEFIDRQDDEFVLQVDDSVGPYSWMYTFETERLEDNAAGIERDRTEHMARGSYSETHMDGRLTTSVSVFTDEERTTVRLPPGGAGALPPAIPSIGPGYSDIDSTPAISVLTPNVGLTNGDLGAPAGINIGGFASGGEINWNMGLQLPGASTVGLLLLNTSTTVDPFFADQFNFAVYASDDNNFWTLVTSSAQFTYEETFDRFRIVVPEVTTEFIKVVNTASPPTAAAVLVTELSAFESLLVTPSPGSSSKLEDTTRSLTSRISYLASETLTFGYDLTLRALERINAGTTTRDEERIDNGLSALWTPTDIVDVSLRMNDQQTKDDILQDEDAQLITGLIDVRPLETLDIALSYTETEREADGDPTLDTDSLKARVAADLLDTLQAEVSIEQNTQQDSQNDRTIDRTIYGASLLADVTPAWDVTVGMRRENAEVTGTGAAGIPDPSEESYELLVVYQPSDQLTAEVDLEWKDSFAGSGLDQRLRLDWIPFPEGAIDIQLDVQRLVSGDIDTQTDRYLLLTRYTFNPRAFFELNYSVQEPDDASRTTLVTLSLNIEFG